MITGIELITEERKEQIEKEALKEIVQLGRIIEINKFRLQDHSMDLESSYPPSIVRDIRKMRSGWRGEIKSCEDRIKELKTLYATKQPNV